MARPTPYTDTSEEDPRLAYESTAKYPGVPRWVKLGGIGALVLVLLVVIVMLLAGGNHGPMRHAPSADSIPAVQVVI